MSFGLCPLSGLNFTSRLKVVIIYFAFIPKVPPPALCIIATVIWCIRPSWTHCRTTSTALRVSFSKQNYGSAFCPRMILVLDLVRFNSGQNEASEWAAAFWLGQQGQYVSQECANAAQKCCLPRTLPSDWNALSWCTKEFTSHNHEVMILPNWICLIEISLILFQWSSKLFCNDIKQIYMYNLFNMSVEKEMQLFKGSSEPISKNHIFWTRRTLKCCRFVNI